MKKHICLFLLISVLISCTNDISEEVFNDGSRGRCSVISVEDAIDIAIEESQNYPQAATSRSVIGRTARTENVVVRKHLSEDRYDGAIYEI